LHATIEKLTLHVAVEIFNRIAQKAKTFSGHLGASVTGAVELANCDH